MIIGYARVSTVDQETARQEQQLSDNKVDKLFIEKASGKNTTRPILNEMLDFIREGDVVIVSDFSRLARNTSDLLKITETITSKGATFKSLKENVDTTTPTGKLMLTVIGAIAEFEREVLLQRQREGIEIAKLRGKYKKEVIPIPSDFKEKVKELEFNKTKLSLFYKVSRPTIYNWIKNVKLSL
ncbi:MAG: recombinase family protein [Fusobacteriaceae bacterium]